MKKLILTAQLKMNDFNVFNGILNHIRSELNIEHFLIKSITVFLKPVKSF